MADAPDLSELVRRTIEANTRFYQGWVNLSLEYFRGITEIFGGVQSAVSAPAPTPAEEAVSDAVVLEAVEGETASGAFLVTNDLGRPLKCELVATGFEGADGEDTDTEVTFDPRSFELQPGEQRVVRAAVAVGPGLAAGAAYTGSFGIKGMTGFAVPAILRKRHAVEVSPIDRLDDAPAAAKKPAAKKPAAKKPAAKKPAAEKRAAKKRAAKKSAKKKAPAKKK